MRSLKNKINQLELEAEELDVVAIIETWLHDQIRDDEICLEGFHEPIQGQRRKSLYIRNEIPIKNRSEEIYTPGVESVWVEATMGNKKTLIGVVYRPPNEIVAYWDLLAENIELAKDLGIDTIFMLGDLNCNLLQPNTRLQQILDSFHLEQLIKSPTHVTENSSTLIDIITTSSADLIKKTEVGSPSLSNHSDITAWVSVDRPPPEKFKRKIYRYEEANWEMMRQDIISTDWERVLRLPDIDQQVETWTSEMTAIVNKNIPNQTVTMSSADS
jgi:hypothetical protein